MTTSHLVDATNAPVTGITFSQLSLFDTPVAGTLLYGELAFFGVLNGNFSYNLGSVIPLDDSLFPSTRWLETRNPGGTLSPRVAINDANDSPEGVSVGGSYKVYYGSAIPPTTVPEPSTTLLCGIALTGVLGYGWRRKHTA